MFFRPNVIDSLLQPPPQLYFLRSLHTYRVITVEKAFQGQFLSAIALSPMKITTVDAVMEK